MLIIRNVQGITNLLGIVLFLIQPKVVSVHNKNTVIPQTGLFQLTDKGPQGIVRIMNSCKIIPKGFSV
ncbi:hypothetical protein D3C85_1492970 [compost metagenome]